MKTAPKIAILVSGRQVASRERMFFEIAAQLRSRGAEVIFLAAGPEPELPLLLIQPTPGWRSLNLREVWHFRELLWFLAWRDIQVRYKQTFFGAAWAVFQPLMAMLVFTLFFGKLVGLADKTGGIPYPVFSFAGLLPWTYFAGALNAASTSVVSSRVRCRSSSAKRARYSTARPASANGMPVRKANEPTSRPSTSSRATRCSSRWPPR